MTFADWLRKRRLTNRKAADDLGVSKEYVRLLRAGLRKPSDKVAALIAQQSNGLVTRADFDYAYEQRQQGKPTNGKLGPVRIKSSIPGTRTVQSRQGKIG